MLAASMKLVQSFPYPLPLAPAVPIWKSAEWIVSGNLQLFWKIRTNKKYSGRSLK
jgi:hypothetical protein